MLTIREGSSLHYSLLWIDERARQRFIARLNLIQALATTLDEVQEPTVAQTKIHWWHEELERLAKGEARHPAVQACQTQLLAGQSTVASTDNSSPDWQSHPAVVACLAIVSAASTARFNTPENNADANSLLLQSFTARMALLAHALNEQGDELALESHPASSALALGKYEQLSRLPQLIHRGQPVFSNEFYRQHQVEPADLASHIRVAGVESELKGIPIVQDNPKRIGLLADAISDTHDALQTALTDTAVAERYRRATLMPLWRLLVLRHKQLSLWKRTKPDLLRERTTLTPLHKLYWAWRNRR